MRFHILGVPITIGGHTTLDEIEQADARYNELHASGEIDRADDLACAMYEKGFLPHWDRENKTFWFTDAK